MLGKASVVFRTGRTASVDRKEEVAWLFPNHLVTHREFTMNTHEDSL